MIWDRLPNQELNLNLTLFIFDWLSQLRISVSKQLPLSDHFRFFRKKLTQDNSHWLQIDEEVSKRFHTFNSTKQPQSLRRKTESQSLTIDTEQRYQTGGLFTVNEILVPALILNPLPVSLEGRFFYGFWHADQKYPNFRFKIANKLLRPDSERSDRDISRFGLVMNPAHVFVVLRRFPRCGDFRKSSSFLAFFKSIFLRRPKVFFEKTSDLKRTHLELFESDIKHF